jgi:protein TonB
MGTLSNEHSMNELVFENRNKLYGAYAIRKSYDGSVIKSFGLAMMALLVLITWYHLMPDVKKVEAIPLPFDPGKPFNLKTDILPPSTPKHHTEPTVRPPDEHAATVFIDSTAKKKEDPIVPEHPDNTTETGTGSTPNPGGHTEGEPRNPDPRPEPILEPVAWADTMPEFPGGEEALMRYMQRNIRYTPYASDAQVNGKMIVRFVVDAEGNVKNIEVLKKIGYGLEEQAQEVIRKMPRWKPGKMRGRAVPVWHVQPISYHMQD